MIILTKPIEISFSDLSKQYGIKVLKTSFIFLQKFLIALIITMNLHIFTIGKKFNKNYFLAITKQQIGFERIRG